jgi:hypothetical protein
MTKATMYLQVNQDLGKVFYYVDVCDIDIGYVIVRVRLLCHCFARLSLVCSIQISLYERRER